MSAKRKIYASFDDAVRDIPDGATIGFGGFAVVGMPINLYRAVARQGAKNLTCVSNSTRGGATLPADAPDMGQIIKNKQVNKVICAFTAPTRASQRLVLTDYVEKGLIEAELTPQGTLAERMRAAGAGIPAFYTPAAVGTELAEGRKPASSMAANTCWKMRCRSTTPSSGRTRRSLRKPPLPAFATQLQSDMAMAARVTVVEVEEEILPVGAIDPDERIPPGSLCIGSSRSRRRPKGGGRSVQGASGDERTGEGAHSAANVQPAGDGIRRRLDRQSRDRHSDPVLEFRFRRQGDHLPLGEWGHWLWPARAPGKEDLHLVNAGGQHVTCSLVRRSSTTRIPSR